MLRRALVGSAVAACASPARPFPLRAPFTIDTDLRPVSVPCRPDPTPDEPSRRTCAPAEYVSPFLWDALDNSAFARISSALSLETSGEARNANSLDEVADSAWFTNRAGTLDAGQLAAGGCTPDDILPTPDQVADKAWRIDHGKDNGAAIGFRVVVPGKGKYMLKADDAGVPEQATAASVIGEAIYHALGFNTPCEQVIVIRRGQLALSPGLQVIDNAGRGHPFDDAALARALENATPVPGGYVRMHASKWLPGLSIGPFRYVGTRADDPNDVVAHEDRRELRGGRVLAAWLNHWDSREQNSLDVWLATDRTHERSSPGVVEHYIIDTSDTLGGLVDSPERSVRLGHTYTFDPADILTDLVTFGAIDRPWDRARVDRAHAKFGYFSDRDFDPERWKGTYPNPAFVRMTERDAAWMARLIARLSPEDLRAIVGAGRFRDPGDAAYLTSVLVARQQRILARYLARLSPLGDVRAASDGRICATDFARLRGVFGRFAYSVVERARGGHVALPVQVGERGEVCFRGAIGEADPRRIVIFELRNGTRAGPLEIHTYDLGARGVRVVGVVRPPP